MKLSQNTNNHYTYLRKPEILVSWWLVQMENTLFRVWETLAPSVIAASWTEQTANGNKKRQVEYKDVCNKSNFIHLHNSIAKAANVQRGQTDGVVLFFNMPHHEEQCPQICIDYLDISWAQRL